MVTDNVTAFIDMLRRNNSPLARQCHKYYECLAKWKAPDKGQRLHQVAYGLQRYIDTSHDIAVKLKVSILLACTCAALDDESALNDSINQFCQIYEQFDK